MATRGPTFRRRGRCTAVGVRRNGSNTGRDGFSLLEVIVATSLIIVGLAALSGSVVSGSKLSESKRENGVAHEAARRFLEELQGEDFRDLFARYNNDPADDPDGPGSAPGSNFNVRGLAPQLADPDGFVGRVEFPVVWVGLDEQLREDVVDPPLGMPRDLDGNGAAPDSADHSDDYILLPVRVSLQYRGVGGNRQLVLEALLTPR